MPTPPTDVVDVELGSRALLSMRSALEGQYDVIVTCENAHRSLWAESLKFFGYAQVCDVGRVDATATAKFCREGDGQTMHVSDACGFRLLRSIKYSFSDSKQVGLCAVLQAPAKKAVGSVMSGGLRRSVVIFSVHLASGPTVTRERVREKQMHEACRFVKATMCEHSSIAGFIVGDLNASLRPVTTRGGDVVPPSTVMAARNEGFKVVVPFLGADSEVGTDKFTEQVWSTFKVRTKRRRDSESAASAVPVHETKRGLSDFILCIGSNSSDPDVSLRVYPEPVSYLMPPAGGPNKMSKMACVDKDHCPVGVTVRLSSDADDTISIKIQNLLAPGLTDEMIIPPDPDIAPPFEASATAAVKRAKVSDEHYVCRDVSDGAFVKASILRAPFRLAVSQRTYEALTLAMDDAWNVSVQKEAQIVKKDRAEVERSRVQSCVAASLY